MKTRYIKRKTNRVAFLRSEQIMNKEKSPKIGAYKMSLNNALHFGLFFNPPKIGAYKIRLFPLFSITWFFNPPKIGAYKILKNEIERLKRFFNPPKIGAYKSVSAIVLIFNGNLLIFQEKKLKIISIKRAFQPVFFNFSDEQFLIS